MARYNNGYVFTNDSCIGCNKCVSTCNVFGSNISVMRDGHSVIQVDSKHCITCGNCISYCVHKARSFKDDTEKFFEALKNKEKISLLVDSSFYFYFGDKAPPILGYLKSLGINKIYDVSYGAEICAWGHVKYLKENQGSEELKPFIAHTCQALVNYLEINEPFLYDYLIPVQSSMVCTAIYVRKYLKETDKLAFLGTCIAKKDEITSLATNDTVQYNVTISNLLEKIRKNDISKYNAKSDLKGRFAGDLISAAGGLKKIVSYFFSPDNIISEYNSLTPDIFEILKSTANSNSKLVKPLMADIQSCKNGCVSGPGVNVTDFNYIDVYGNYCNRYKEISKDFFSSEDNYEVRYQKFDDQFNHLNVEDFKRTYTNRYRQPYSIPASTFEEIFTIMHKDTPEKREINCRACGYQTCKRMAEAIAYGFNRKENCINYMKDEMNLLYNTDSQTGLLNRQAFIQKAKEILEENIDSKYAICCGDINRFKIINDLYGTATGDKVLREIGKILQNTFDSTAIISSQGNGGFSFIFQFTMDNFEKLRNIKTFDCKSLGIDSIVTMRFGIYIATIEDDPDSVIEMLNYATISMDQNVSLIKNVYTVFSDELQKQRKQEILITQQMPFAMENKEFVLYFQPQYHVATGKLVGAETLCRWVSPGGKIISPANFIPIAEKNGFIRILDRYIWEKTYATIRGWLDRGIEPVPISINISRVSLQSGGIVGIIEHLRKTYNIPEKYIHFEITESACMDDMDNMVRQIQEIQRMGYEIAMDDFGSGYSSLNTLKDISIDILKLDMGFLQESANKDKGSNIISSIVRMAQSLNLTTIAEGIETEEQANFLGMLGCDIIQGFLYAKPMPEAEFYKLLQNEEKLNKVEKTRLMGEININHFNDPNSIENLMFEKYTGAAAIVEFDSIMNKVSMLRYNTAWKKLFGFEEWSFSEVKDVFREKTNSKDEHDIKDNLIKLKDTEEVTFVSQFTNFEKNIPIWLKVNAKKLSIVGTTTIAYLLFDDVTEEKLTESTLSLSNSQMSLVLEKSVVGMCLMHLEIDLKRPKESVKLRILKTNPQFIELSGFPEEEVMSWTEKECLGVIHPLDKPGFVAKTLKAFVNKYKKPYSYTYRARTKDGSYRKVQIFVTGIIQSPGKYLIITNYIPVEELEKTKEFKD